MKTRKYKETIWTFIFEEIEREPLWFVSDLIINPNNLKVEWILFKDSFFKEPKLLEINSLAHWWKDISISEDSIKKIGEIKEIKTILLKEIWIIWKKVSTESWEYIWTVKDFIFNWDNFQWINLVVQKSFFWLFFYWKEILIWKKRVINIEKEIIINDNLIKA